MTAFTPVPAAIGGAPRPPCSFGAISHKHNKPVALPTLDVGNDTETSLVRATGVIK